MKRSTIRLHYLKREPASRFLQPAARGLNAGSKMLSKPPKDENDNSAFLNGAFHGKWNNTRT